MHKKAASPGRPPAPRRSSAQKAAQARGIASARRGDLGEVAFVHKAMSLGYVVAKPYGQMHRYDFMVEAGPNIWRVQVKSCMAMSKGLYCVMSRCHTNHVEVAYSESDFDFLVAYVMSEETWYVLPVCAVVGHGSLLFRPKGYTRRDPYACYRGAWHLLGEPNAPAL
jgi:hypothetical protein